MASGWALQSVGHNVLCDLVSPILHLSFCICDAGVESQGKSQRASRGPLISNLQGRENLFYEVIPSCARGEV